MAKEVEYVTEDEFFKVAESNPVGPNNSTRLPMTPWVLIQFRTAVVSGGTEEDYERFLSGFVENGGYNIAVNSEWTTVSFRKRTNGYAPKNNLTEDLNSSSLKFDNFFDSVTLEDNGGLVNCNLKLYDSNFGNLEQLILKSILAMKAANQYYEKSIDENDTFMLQFQAGAPQNVNFRIRFGYADATLPNSDIIDIASSTSGEFENRVLKVNKNKMVIRAPWKYFQMMDCKFSVAESGMYADIKGISIGTSVFDRLKIVQRFAMLRGTPELLIKNLAEQLFESSAGMIQVVDEGGKVITGKTDAQLGSLKNLIDEADERSYSNFKSVWGVTWNIRGNSEEAFNTWLTEQYGDENAVTGAERDNILARKKTQRESDANMYRIEVMYGAEPRPQTDRNGRVIPGSTVRSYQNIKQLFRNICSKVPPIYRYEIDGEELYIDNNTPSEVAKIFAGSEDPVDLGDKGKFDRGIFKPIRYTFKTQEISLGEEGATVIRVAFEYAKPQIQDQQFLRKYTWRNNKNNLIKSFSIASEFDFAQMSTSIAVVNDEEMRFYMAPPTTSTNTDENASGALGSSKYDPTANNRLQLVSDIVENTEGGDGEGGSIDSRNMAQQLIHNMNQQVFRGTIELPGDPFYQFDSAMEPYKYGIYIEVLRDFNYYLQELTESNEKSYMSGFYVLKKITHNIGKGGFSTQLDLDKWPTQALTLKKRT